MPVDFNPADFRPKLPTFRVATRPRVVLSPSYGKRLKTKFRKLSDYRLQRMITIHSSSKKYRLIATFKVGYVVASVGLCQNFQQETQAAIRRNEIKLNKKKGTGEISIQADRYNEIKSRKNEYKEQAREDERERDSWSSLLFRVMITHATTVVLIIRTMMDHFRTEGMRPNNT